MDLLPSAEQQQVIDAIAAFLSSEHSLAAIQAVNARRPLTQRSLWRQFGELGWLGIGMDENVGGAGFAVAEEMLLLIEAGKYLVSPALFGSLLGARLAALSGNHDLAQSIITGEKIVAVGLATGIEQALSETLSGEFFLLESGAADFILLVDHTATALIAVADLPPQREQQCIDDKLQLTSVTLQNIRCANYLAGKDLPTRAAVLCAAYLVGVAQALQQLAVAYATERHQFGKPIGSFQAIKHRCADMALRGEAALAMTLQAGLGLQAQHGDVLFDAQCAKVLAQDAALQNGADCIHIHGGMGFTAEMPIHLFFKRAQVISQLAGDKHALLHALSRLPTPAF